MFGADGQHAGGLVVVMWVWQPACSFIISWHGEDFHGLRVQGAKVSALPGASPLPIVSPVSFQIFLMANFSNKILLYRIQNIS
jgi:hypothetical protein